MSTRHRITILNHEDTHDNIIKTVNNTYLSLNDVNYTREDKYTIGVKNQFFKTIKHLRITVGSIKSDVFHYNSNNLNIYAVPSTKDQAKFYQEINGFINQLFGTNVDASNWIKSKDSLFLHLQEYKLDNFQRLMSEISHDKVNSEVIDFGYDGKPNGDDRVTFSFINDNHSPIVYNDQSDGYVEVGLFLIDANSNDNDIILAGSRIIMGAPEDEFFKKTMFHIKPKYRLLPTSTNEIISNGLHPKLKTTIVDKQLKIIEARDDDIKDCQLYVYIQLEKSLFIDKYNLGDNIELVVNLGTNDLELPAYKLPEWGNEILLQIIDPFKPIELNLHSRYQKPSNDGTNQTTILIDNPTIVYGCDDTSDRNILSYSPFLNDFPIKSNYEKFFTNNTIFYESFDSNNQLEIEIPIPRAKFVSINAVTGITIIIGILMILQQIFKVILGRIKKEDITIKKDQ